MSSNITNRDTLRRVLDFRSPIADVIGTLKNHWEYDLQSRSPGPAYLENGVLQPTDLDAACLLATLAKRQAVIVMPKYLSAGPTQQKTGQTVTSADFRTGQLVRLQSNKEFFAFNALVIDQNVKQADGSVGAPRAFHVIGKDGRWHPGWSSIEFVPNAKENDFIEKFGLAQKGEVAFKNFVAPQRWMAFYGQYYALTKLVIERLEAEAKATRAKIKELREKEGKKPSSDWRPDDGGTKWQSTRIEVPVMEVEFDAPWRGAAEAPEGLSLPELEAHLKEIDYDHLPTLRFAARATEYAFYKGRGEAAGIPAFAKKTDSWSDQKIARTTWRAMPGAITETTIRYRIRAKEIEVDQRL